MKIREARENDAQYIGKAVVMAVGDELATEFAGSEHTVEDVVDMFAELATRTDSQYSYKNTLIAEVTDDHGNDHVAGVCIAYDGAQLHRLREVFFEAAKRRLDRDMRGMADETDAGEFYLDTLAVFPEYRGQGIARELIKGQSNRAHRAGKPLGLLVEKENHQARKLYQSVGFRYVGERAFASVMMDHLSAGGA